MAVEGQSATSSSDRTRREANMSELLSTQRASGIRLTIPFPLYGIFRYLYLVHQRDGGGNPADLLVGDRPLFACVALWIVTVILIIYV